MTICRTGTIRLLLAAFFAGISAGIGLAVGPVDLLDNGGFEQGLVGWTADAGHELLNEAKSAHSGTRCITGEVTGPNQSLQLRRAVAVKARNRYQFEVWARATNRTKLVLWAVQPGAQQRKIVAAWENLPPRWQRLSTPVPVEADGTLELHLIAPSSHNAPAGRIWIDDLALYETELPQAVCLSEGAGFNDEPAMALAADGSVYVAWNSFREGRDTLQLARMIPSGDSFRRSAAWEEVNEKDVYVLGPQLVADGTGAALVYAAEKGKRWDIYAAAYTSEGLRRRIAVTNDAVVDVDPAAALHAGVLWIAWESNRGGGRQVFVSAIADGNPTPPEAVSPADCSAYDPAIAVLPSGQVCVAWHAFRNGNYDIYLRCRSAAGQWGLPRRLTSAATIDRHPQLFAHGEELWLVYENARVSGYHIGSTNFRRLFVAKVTPQGLVVPDDDSPNCPLAGRCEAGTLAIDAQGRPWLAMLRPRLPRAGWDVFLTCYAQGKWQPLQPVSSGKGMDRRPLLAIDGEGAVVAFQSDTIPNSWSNLDQTASAVSEIHLARVRLDSAPLPGRMNLVALAEPDDPFEPAALREEHGEDLPTPSIQYQGQTLHLYFGDLHEHTDVSVCNRLGDQSIDESYQHMRDIARYDFACATDHGYNLNPYLWCYTAKLARTNDDPNRFLTFLAEEWTSTFEEYSQEHPFGFYGHRNLILADPYFPRWWNARNRQTPAEVWEDLRKLNANFVHIPHQLADTGNVPTDWNFTDEVAQPVAEIFQTRGSYEYKGTPREAVRSTPEAGYFLQDAWARGIVIGVIASPDHGGGYGKACVFAPQLSREAILEALRRRRCYGTTAAKIFLDVRVSGRLMGEKVADPAPEKVEVVVCTRCPGEIERIDVCRNNRFIYTATPGGKRAELTYVDRDPLPDRSYYYVRVIQTNGEIAWSSPVWFGAD